VTDDRLHEAGQLIGNGRADEALRPLAAFWDDPKADYLQRMTMFIELLQMACEQSAAVRSHFAAVRDSFAPRSDDPREGLSKWLALNDALGEEAVTLAWFDDRVRRGALPVPMLSRVVAHVLRRARPEEYLAFTSSPLEYVREVLQLDTSPPVNFDAEIAAELAEADRARNRLDAALMYLAVAAAQPQLQAQLHAAISQLDDSPEMQALMRTPFAELARRAVRKV
jgi:hypothetical protein